MNKDNFVSNKLRVLHYPQIPCDPFIVEVNDEEQAHLIVETLADQHIFLFEKRIIPDYANIILVQMWGGDEDETPDWVDYYNEKVDMEFNEFVEEFLK